MESRNIYVFLGLFSNFTGLLANFPLGLDNTVPDQHPVPNTFNHHAIAPPQLPTTPVIPTTCSQLPLEKITHLMLRDLPGYANRVTQRARRLKRQGETYSYILVAGKAEFQPLPLNPQPTSRLPHHQESPDIEQVFFTTLERRYTAKTAIEMQQYHWLLLTKTPEGWYQVSMRSQTGSYPSRPNQILAPLRDSSQGVVGEAVNLWLRDCRANSVKF